MTKQEIRKEYLKIRNSLTNRVKKSKIITKKILELDIYKNAKVIGIYKSFSNEVDTSFLIKEALKNKIVCVPVVNDNAMNFYEIKKDTIYNKNSYGI